MSAVDLALLEEAIVVLLERRSPGRRRALDRLLSEYSDAFVRLARES